MSNTEITLEQLLDSREQRAAHQRQLLRYPGCLISFMINMPGSIKYCDLSLRLHEIGMKAILQAIADSHLEVLHREVRALKTGIEGFVTVKSEAEAVKKLTVAIEEQHPLGRLFDIDVLRPDGTQISRSKLGSKVRKCLLCDHDGAICARSKAHTSEELIAKMQEMLDYYEL